MCIAYHLCQVLLWVLGKETMNKTDEVFATMELIF